MSLKIKNVSNTISKIRYLKIFAKIKRLVKEINPDILHAQYATSYGLIGSLVNYKPYILSAWEAMFMTFQSNQLFIKYS